MDQRFKQFSGLVDNCEFSTGEKETTCTDLQGFWDMVYFQVRKSPTIKYICFWPNLSWKGVVSDYQIYHERVLFLITKFILKGFCFWLPNLSWKGFVSDYQIYHERVLFLI